jgi:riboflavin biosynthesis pyrimidine reductase
MGHRRRCTPVRAPARHDAVVGASTIRRRPSPVVHPRVDAARVVRAPRAGLDPAARVFRRDRSAPPARVYVASTCTEAEAAPLRAVAEIVPVADGACGLDLSAVLADLRDAGVQSVLVEGGGKTSGAFLRLGLVDEIVLFIAGRLFGAGDATPVVDVPAAADPGTGGSPVRSSDGRRSHRRRS